MKSIRTALAAGVLLIVGGCQLNAPDPTVDPSSMTHNNLPVHDPSVIRADDGSYYVFGSHLAANGECTGPRSYLGLATSDHIGGPYVNEGIASYDATIHPNTIDPDVFYDRRLALV